MGMTVLYIAFGFVALWLLAEVLMQYKARLRWRLLAFTGFVGVVAGVVLPSVLVIGAGAVAFAIGQTLVTLSFRKGFVSGWSLRRGKAPEPELAQSRRRRPAAGTRPEPSLEVTALEYGPDPAGDEDSDEDSSAFTTGAVRAQVQGFHPGQPAADASDATGPYGAPGETGAFASPFTSFAPSGQAEQDAHQYAAYYDPQTQGGYDYTTGYPAPGEQQVYAAYSDPYIGTGGAVAPQQPYGYPAPYGGYAPDPYATGQQEQYSTDTPPGGVWVPQQRDANQPYPAEEQQQPYPYPYQGTGEYEQYRY
ncbi:hypothetical protein ACIA8F_07690 [Streptomyces sp. NPDC051563]|uniref:hypothetical protein n=1 Tax=Streptomyces sp. NPDC051563 TaxID=3365659 RepID=UPI0037B76243